MDLVKLIELFGDKGCRKIYAKTLAGNDNSKNQVYLGGSFDILNIFPFTDIVAEDKGDWKRSRFKAKLDFFWLKDTGELCHAPATQLILYPKYPEVRLSGFLKGCSSPPSDLMTQRLEGRILFLSVDSSGNVISYVVEPENIIAKELAAVDWGESHGVFKVIPVEREFSKFDSQDSLIEELRRIHQLKWIDSKRLDGAGNILPCKSSNCGGYTLEAELGVTPNGYSEPDYLGWEIKQFSVKRFDKYNTSIVTLMTPEPTGGFYKEKGVDWFIMNYGYPDKLGRPDRLNFGGIHKFGIKHDLTNLVLDLPGFDIDSGKIRNTAGRIALIDDNDNEAASWSFTSLLDHWRRKHSHASYIPSMMRKDPTRQYWYGNNILLCSGTSFELFLQQMSKGLIYYDPGIKMEHASTKPKIKRRSQFRIKSGNLKNLYFRNEIIDIIRPIP